MESNMSRGDRVVRAIIALGIFSMILLNIISGTAAVILGIVGGVFFLTAIFGFCPLYKLAGIATKKSE